MKPTPTSTKDAEPCPPTVMIAIAIASLARDLERMGWPHGACRAWIPDAGILEEESQ